MKLQLLAVAAIASQAAFGEQARKTTPPAAGPIAVAFVITEGATMIDFAGPWEVFQDVMVGEGMPLLAPRCRLTAQLGDPGRLAHGLAPHRTRKAGVRRSRREQPR
jgi:hypothetical protein